AVAYGLFVLMLIAIFWGTTETGRLFLPRGKFSNPNEMAQALLLGLALWWLVFQNARSGPMKVLAMIVMLFMVITISKTGSRGALIGFAVLIASIFFRSSIAGKLKIIIGGFILLVFLVTTMPKKLLNRYATLTEEE